jgi:hypothetical protein
VLATVRDNVLSQAPIVKSRAGDWRGAVCDKRCPLGAQGDICSSRGLCNDDAGDCL